MNEKDNKKENNTEHSQKQYSVSNTTIIVLIVICIVFIVGVNLMKRYAENTFKQALEDHPELIHSANRSNTNKLFKSSKDLISFSHSDDWIVTENKGDNLTIIIENKKNADDGCVIIVYDSDYDPAAYLTDLSSNYKANTEKFTEVTGLTKCQIGKLPAIRKNIDIVKSGNIFYVSLIAMSVNGQLFIISESATSSVKRNELFKTIEETIEIKN